MPQAIEHIDKIARDKGRSVLYLTFDVIKQNSRTIRERRKLRHHLLGNMWLHKDEYQFYNDYNDNPNRQIIIDWLEENNIKYELCGDFASENGFRSYTGQIYLDFPYDETNEDYQKFANFYKETKRGWSKKFHAVRFCALSLECAMKNKHHDEPNFWENWAENF